MLCCFNSPLELHFIWSPWETRLCSIAGWCGGVENHQNTGGGSVKWRDTISTVVDTRNPVKGYN